MTAFLDPVRAELDRLRTENARLRAQNANLQEAIDRARIERAQAEDAETAADARMALAEARVEALTQELATVRDTLRHRSNALNATGTHNDQLRAQLAQMRALLARAWSLADEWADFGQGRGWGELVDDIRAALADKEPTP